MTGLRGAIAGLGPAALAAVAIIALIACSPRHEIENISLVMRSNNEFALNGKTIKSGKLKSALAAIIKPGSKVCVTVSKADLISESDIQAAIHQVQDAGISCVGTVGVDSP